MQASQERPWRLLVALALAGFALGAVVLIGLRYREPPAICGPELQSLGPVCCARGQELDQGACTGEIVTCPTHMNLVQKPRPGCVQSNQIIGFPAGKLTLSPLDWEAQGRVQPREATLQAFSLDSLEVTAHRWQDCVQANSCKALTGSPDPGEPVAGVTPSMAERFCLFVGGRLPTSDEWVYAASGPTLRRYPWGNTGLVCRRAAFGLLKGPCASGAIGPTLAGSRPAGRTPEGLFDMAGNVAEWTRQNDTYVARGGSFRSVVAHELKAWASESTREANLHIGFRCAYDPPG